jgi:hypothetical protein
MKARTLILVAALAIQFGCQAELGGATLLVRQDGDGLKLTLHHTDNGCSILPGATAFVDGTPMETLSTGRITGGLFGLPICEEPLWRFYGYSPGETTTFEIHAPGAKARATFANLAGARSATFIDLPEGTLHAGQSITIDWSPNTDNFSPDPKMPLPAVYIWQVDPTTGGILYLVASRSDGEITIEGTRIHATIPD